MRFFAAFIATLLLCPIARAQDPMQFAPFMTQSRVPTDWELRVLANGGAQPSQNTVNAMERFRLKQIERGVTNILYNVCVHVPDSVIAAFTPIFYHKGWAYWTNNFVIGDLTVNGIKGDGSTKIADTGVQCVSGQALSADGSGGMSVLVTEMPRPGTFFTQSAKTLLGRADPDADPVYQLAITVNGNSFFVPGDTASAGNYVQAGDYCRIGWLSGNQDGNLDDVWMYGASPQETFRTLQVDTSVVPELTVLVNTITEFGLRRGDTNETATFTTNRISFAAIHGYMTAEQSSNLWFDVKTLREELGGGTGDPTHDWATFLASQGATVSTTTSNAVRNHGVRMNGFGIRVKMLAENCFVPDGLLAARTPSTWNAGHPIWQNTGFGETNLSVHGLDGAPSGKYLRTGISNTTVAVSLANNAGISIMFTNTSVQVGGTTGDTSTHFSIVTANTAGPAWALIFGFGGGIPGPTVLVGGNYFGGNTNYGHFTSGNRLSATDLALYVAAQSVPHYMITNTTLSGSSSLGNNHEFIACGQMTDNNPLTIVGSGPGAFSYIAVHNGLTQTESSNHYSSVYQLRVDLGGGNR